MKSMRVYHVRISKSNVLKISRSLAYAKSTFHEVWVQNTYIIEASS